MSGPDDSRGWTAALAELKMTMTAATFEGLLAGSRPVARENGTVVVALRGSNALSWLDRLQPQIAATARRYIGGCSDVRFVAPEPAGREGQAGGEDAAGREEGGREDDVDVHLVVDPALARFDMEKPGWSKLTNYALDFWAELLGPAAFLTWMAIRAEDVRREKTAWTRPLRFSVARLARVAAAGNSQAITGVWRSCHSRGIVERGEPCAECQARGGQIGEDGRSCRYWRPGAFDVLQDNGVAAVQRAGEGLDTSYRVRVFNVLPLLTPAQVGRLHAVTQEAHDRWLRRQDLDTEAWERLTVAHLVLEKWQ